MMLLYRLTIYFHTWSATWPDPRSFPFTWQTLLLFVLFVRSAPDKFRWTWIHCTIWSGQRQSRDTLTSSSVFWNIDTNSAQLIGLCNYSTCRVMRPNSHQSTTHLSILLIDSFFDKSRHLQIEWFGTIHFGLSHLCLIYSIHFTQQDAILPIDIYSSFWVRKNYLFVFVLI